MTLVVLACQWKCWEQFETPISLKMFQRLACAKFASQLILKKVTLEGALGMNLFKV